MKLAIRLITLFKEISQKSNHGSNNKLLFVSVSYYDTTSGLQGIIPVEVTMSDHQLATFEVGDSATISIIQLDIPVENNNSTERFSPI